ncbi:hypothetical protein ACOSP7_012684 [Xanthoceras sorbifolium]
MRDYGVHEAHGKDARRNKGEQAVDSGGKSKEVEDEVNEDTGGTSGEPLQGDSVVCEEGEARGFVTTDSLALEDNLGGQLMASLIPAQGLGGIANGMAVSVGEGGRARSSGSVSHALSAVLATSQLEDRSFSKKTRWKRLARGRGHMECDGSSLFEKGKRGASELGESAQCSRKKGKMVLVMESDDSMISEGLDDGGYDG